MSSYSSLTNLLRSLLGILELDSASSLYQDTIAICKYLENSIYRIAVFAPFNHGKSTLLNALLGSKTLPIDLIPTTGAAICVSYGEKLQTVISLKDGTTIQQEGIKILKQYAILDDDRRMKDEVKEVTVFCNHYWLKTGVEFLDLPGTNDREAQNDLVRDKLLSADLVIHVLDARKLMTLEEREHLKEWLENRGITTVIFVVNFLNLLTVEERHEVKKRLCFIAESFRSNLSYGISNVYCVDALPALRARLKGNQADAKTTGITSLESALQNIASLNQQQNKLPRTVKVAQELLNKAALEQQKIQQEINNQQEQALKQTEVKLKAKKLIQQGFNRSISDFRGWLYLPKLLADYQPSLAIALQQTAFDRWLEAEFQPDVFKHQQGVNKWVNKGCEFFQYSDPQLLLIDFIHSPIIEIPEWNSQTQTKNNIAYKSYIPQELNFLLQKKAGAVVLGGASYIINKLATKSQPADNNLDIKSTRISSQVYVDAAKTYLQEFSDRLNLLINKYEQIAYPYITYIPASNNRQMTTADYQLKLLTNLIDNLTIEINRLNK